MIQISENLLKIFEEEFCNSKNVYTIIYKKRYELQNNEYI